MFEVDPFWPKPLPNGWVTGNNIGIALDANDHIWMIHRVSGVASSFKFGVTVGSILSIVQARMVPLHFVTPGKWKRDLGLPSDKHAALDKALLMYPTAELDKVDADASARAIIEAQDRKISEMSGRPGRPIKTIRRSAAR